jgi:AraC family transcriptional regulator
VVHLSEPVTLETKHGAQVDSRRLAPGQILLYPARAVVSECAAGPLEWVSVSLDPAFMSTACCDAGGPGQLELRLEHGLEDGLIKTLCLELKREVEQGGPSGRLYAETLGTSLALHLAIHYSSRKNRFPQEVKGGLSPRVVRQALAFIHERLTEDFSLGEIAAAVGLSPFHFARMFKRTLGLSPHQFVTSQRLEAAKQMMIRGELPLMEIAVELGFFDQSHFTNHFKRTNGMTPREFIQHVRGA